MMWMEMAMDVDRDWKGVDRDGDVDRNAKWRQEIGMEMERNNRDLKLQNAIFAISVALNFRFG